MDALKLLSRIRPPVGAELYARATVTAANGEDIRVPAALRGRMVRFYAVEQDVSIRFHVHAVGAAANPALPAAAMNVHTAPTASVLGSDGTPAPSANASIGIVAGDHIDYELPKNCYAFTHKAGATTGFVVWHLSDNGVD